MRRVAAGQGARPRRNLVRASIIAGQPNGEVEEIGMERDEKQTVTLWPA
jgi:hypothetical protein